jgi:hypothetical protein
MQALFGQDTTMASPSVFRHGVQELLAVVRAENFVRSCDQQSCPLCRPAMMITGHVPAVRLPPDHAADLMAAVVSA